MLLDICGIILLYYVIIHYIFQFLELTCRGGKDPAWFIQEELQGPLETATYADEGGEGQVKPLLSANEHTGLLTNQPPLFSSVELGVVYRWVITADLCWLLLIICLYWGWDFVETRLPCIQVSVTFFSTSIFQNHNWFFHYKNWYLWL